MVSFTCDYTEGAHPLILKRLIDTNMIQAPGYGEDEFCQSAKDKIRLACAAPGAQVFFLVDASQVKALQGKVDFEIWETLPDGRCVTRFATSWATTDGAIEELGRIFRACFL